MEKKEKIIIIKSIDYLENDKIVTGFGYESGIIAFKARGIKKQKSKLKPAMQPLTFCETEFLQRGEYLTLKQAKILDSNGYLLTDFDKMQSAFIVLDILQTILPQKKAEPQIFDLVLQSFLSMKSISNTYISVIDFMFKFAQVEGNAIIDKNIDLFKDVFLDYHSGQLSNSVVTGEKVSKKLIEDLQKIFLNEDLDKLSAKNILILMRKIYKLKFDVNIKTLNNIL